MANKQIVFADRLVGLSLQNGLVRLDLAVHAGQVKDKEGKTGQRMDINTQLVMPLDAFAQAVGMQQSVLKQLAARVQDAEAAKAAKGEKSDKAAKAEKSDKAEKAGKA